MLLFQPKHRAGAATLGDTRTSSYLSEVHIALGKIHNASKDPIRVAPLRDPGQSLRESLEDLLLDTIAPWLTVAVLAVVIAAIDWFRWSLNLPPHPLVLTIVAIGTVVLAIR